MCSATPTTLMTTTTNRRGAEVEDGGEGEDAAGAADEGKQSFQHYVCLNLMYCVLINDQLSYRNSETLRLSREMEYEDDDDDDDDEDDDDDDFRDQLGDNYDDDDDNEEEEDDDDDEETEMKIPGLPTKPCPQCQERFTTQDGFLEHIATHSSKCLSLCDY